MPRSSRVRNRSLSGRPSASTNSVVFVATHVAEARFYLLKMFGIEQTSPLAAYLENARGIDDVKRFPPMAEIQRVDHGIPRASRPARRNDGRGTGRLDRMPVPAPDIRPNGVEPVDVLRTARQLSHRAAGAPQEARGSA